MAPAYLNKLAANPHSGACKHSLQYYEKPEWRFWVQVGMWNIGSQSGKGFDFAEELRKRMIDVCCLQEVRWRGQGGRMMGMEGMRCRLWWYGKGS